MAGGSYQDEGAIAEINVTPLVDVVLVLLVIFMVTAPLIAAQGILVDSPEASTGTSVEGTLTLSVTQNGELLLVHEQKQWRFEAKERSKALPTLQKLFGQNPKIRAIIAGDKNVAYGALMEVIDMVRSAGIHKFSLRTKPKL